MKVGDKVIVNPILPRLHDAIWGIPMEQIKGKIMTIRCVSGEDGTHYCYVKEEGYIFPCSMFIPVEGTLFLAIHERRQYETRRQSSS